MRKIVFLLLCLLASPARANYVQVGGGGPTYGDIFSGSVTVNGNFPPDGLVVDIFLQGGGSFNGDAPSIWSISVLLGQVASVPLFECAVNDGECGKYTPIITESALFLTSDFRTISYVADVSTFGQDVGPVTFSLFADLPNGFSVAAVPEPSTWAMLLLGFASLGLMGYRSYQWRNTPAKLIAAAFLLLALQCGPTRASIVELPLSGVVQVVGNYGTYSTGFNIFFSLVDSTPAIPQSLDNADANYYFVTFTIQSQISVPAWVSACQTSVIGGGCGRYFPDQDQSTISSDARTLSISESYSGNVTPDVALFVSLPDGFSIASPVPEPSTWAMLVIGFAGVYAMAYRRSRKNALVFSAG